MLTVSRAPVTPLLRKALSSAHILTAERERELLHRFHDDGSKAAMDELVRSHMPIIFRVAGRSAQNPGVDINDLIQTATEGLLIAINRWSFEKSDASGARYANSISQENAAPDAEVPDGEDAQAIEAVGEEVAPPQVHATRLATYALWWMRIMLTNSVIDNRGVVVRAKNQKVRKALFRLPAAIHRLNIAMPLSGSDVVRLSVFLDIGVQYIEEALVHAAGDVMLDEPIGDGSMLRGDVIADQSAEGEAGILNRLATTDSWNAVCTELMQLSPRDRFILITRYLLSSKWKLDRLSDALQMSRERIRQIGCDGLAGIRRRIGPDGASHTTTVDGALAEIEMLVEQIEAASVSVVPGAVAELLRRQNVVTGTTRIGSRKAAATGPAKARVAHQV